MKKARLLILVGLLLIANAVEASSVFWIDSGGRLIYRWDVNDGYNDTVASQSYYQCMMAYRAFLRRTNKSK